MTSMPMRWFVQVLVLCLAVVAAGWAPVCAAHGEARQITPTLLATSTSSQIPSRQFSMIADADHDDADCDDDGCGDGHCRHCHVFGCDMGACSSSGAALQGQAWAFPMIATTDAIVFPVVPQVAAMRATLPLRPPIP